MARFLETVVEISRNRDRGSRVISETGDGSRVQCFPEIFPEMSREVFETQHPRGKNPTSRSTELST